LRELAAGKAPLLMIPELLDKTDKQARHEVEARNSAMLLTTLEDRDNQVLNLLKRNKVPARQLHLVERQLQADRDDRAGTVAETSSSRSNFIK